MKIIARILIILAFVIALLELILEVLTITLYSRLTNKLGIKDMFGYKLLMYAEKFY